MCCCMFHCSYLIIYLRILVMQFMTTDWQLRNHEFLVLTLHWVGVLLHVIYTICSYFVHSLVSLAIPLSSRPSLDSTFSDTPSAKYEARTGKGGVVASFNIPDKANIHWKGCLNKPALIKNFDDCSIQEPFKYMFQKLQDKADGKSFSLGSFFLRMT